MLDGKSVLGLIVARGGSKRLPGKNVMPFAGRPLIAWTVEAARQSKYVDRVVLSSDDAEIIAVAEQYGCDVPFVRPPELASDDASSMDVIVHALNAVEKPYDVVVLLQPTSPLRTAADIDGCLEMFGAGDGASVVSVSPVPKPPEWMYRVAADGRMSPLLTADQAGESTPSFGSELCVLNGAVYVLHGHKVLAGDPVLEPTTLAYVMPAERSVDIDTAWDFTLGEIIKTHDF